jgi:hypothetical protein
MVTIRSANEIILSLIDFFKLAQPDLDTKPGTVARDLFIDAPSSALSILYNELAAVSSQQSLRLVIGSDLDKLGKNFGMVRKQSTPSTGVALLTFSSINAPININRNDRVIASNGFAYSVTAGVSVTPASSNFYRSIASKFRDQLDLAGISDEFAVEVTVVATTAGLAGNIGTYSISRTVIPGVSNATNVVAFAGGTDQESDASFRNRILSSFSGSSVGTALGYLNVALGTTGVSDAFVVQPGDSLMTRDGTEVKVGTDGTRTIVSEGSGGKVDVVILGSNLVENKDTFIYRDKSNNNDPTSKKNDIVLGQIVGDENKTVNRKRIDNIKNGVLPIQPVNEILEVTGSGSGNNFIEKTVDTLGRVFGNYELVKDTGVYGGSPWGFDTFHWVSDRISLFNEDRIKGLFNGQDAVTFTDVLAIPQAQQNISITNENSTVTSDRSIIQLLHTPATNVTRVFNVHTGERYIITDQNLDKTGSFNTTGRIKISGNTLPSQSDPLQVDYSWIVNYDPHSDYDGLSDTENIRAVTDSTDWGFASNVRQENIKFAKDSTGNFFTGTASHPIVFVNNASSYLEVDGTVNRVLSGTFVNRMSVTLRNLALSATSIDSVTFKNTNVELYQTAQNNGTFTNTSVVVGINVLVDVTIILPNDTVAADGDRVSVILNSVDVFHSDVLTGSTSGSQITIPSTLIDTLASTINLRVNYIANISDLFSASTNQLPTSRVGNGYLLGNNNGFNNFSPVNISRRENQIVQKNTSNQLYVELFLPGSEFALLVPQIVTVIRLSDNKEIWDAVHPGTITVGTTGNYQLIFSGFNAPVTGDRVLIVYYATDIRRFQPFSYENYIIKSRISTLTVEPLSGKLTIPINAFITDPAPISFVVYEPNTDIVLFSITDGYIISLGNGTATLTSPTTTFSVLPDLLNKKVKVVSATSSQNNGYYDILAYDLVTNKILITNVLSKITPDNIMVIRILDGQEIWNYSGTIDFTNNRLLIPVSSSVHAGDAVFVVFFRHKGLRRAPTKIIGTTVDQVVNTGTVNVAGTTLAKAEDIIFTATNTGLKLNIGEALRKALSLPSTTPLPSNVRLARVVKVEKVVTASVTNDEVLEVLTTYDVKNTTIQNNLLYSNDMLSDSSLQNLDLILPNTANNTLNTETHNLPTLGDKIRITFYYMTDNDSESLSYTRNGTLYTNKKFAFINKMFASSGFKASQSTKFTATSFTQPSLGSRYKVFYDYLAPKQNERILVRYNYNKLIADVTFNIENTRPINADVLVRQAKRVLLDLTMNVVIADDFKSSQSTVLQNLRDKLLTALTTNKLGQIVDAPTLINIAQGVSGVARARILYFNKTGGIGQVLKVQAQSDEYFAPNNLIINTETR